MDRYEIIAESVGAIFDEPGHETKRFDGTILLMLKHFPEVPDPKKIRDAFGDDYLRSFDVDSLRAISPELLPLKLVFSLFREENTKKHNCRKLGDHDLPGINALVDRVSKNLMDSLILYGVL